MTTTAIRAATRSPSARCIERVYFGGDVFTLYAMLTTDEPAVTVSLEATGDGGKPLAIQFQVFAYDGDELLGASDVWAIEVGK